MVFVRILLCAALTGDGVEQKLPDIAEILLQLILLYLPRYLRKFPPLYLLPRLQLPYSDPAVMDLSVTVFVQILLCVVHNGDTVELLRPDTAMERIRCHNQINPL